MSWIARVCMSSLWTSGNRRTWSLLHQAPWTPLLVLDQDLRGSQRKHCIFRWLFKLPLATWWESVCKCHPRTALLLSLSAQFVAQIRRRDVMVVSAAIFFLSAWAATHSAMASAWRSLLLLIHVSGCIGAISLTHTHMITHAGMYIYIYIYTLPSKTKRHPPPPFLINIWNDFYC